MYPLGHKVSLISSMGTTNFDAEALVDGGMVDEVKKRPTLNTAEARSGENVVEESISSRCRWTGVSRGTIQLTCGEWGML